MDFSTVSLVDMSIDYNSYEQREEDVKELKGEECYLCGRSNVSLIMFDSGNLICTECIDETL